MTADSGKSRLRSVAEAARLLLQQIRRHISDKPRDVLRLEVAVESVDLLRWLSAQHSSTKMYWRDRDRTYEVAGIGRALSVESPRLLRGALRKLDPASCLFGGCRFDSDREPDPIWKSFPDTLFFAPVVELFVIDGCFMLACNVNTNDQTSVENVTRALKELEPPRSRWPVAPQIVSRNESPSKTRWSETINYALGKIAQGKLTKVVLARQLRLELSAPANPWQLLSCLRDVSGSTYLFGIQPYLSSAFIGASPECLFKRQEEEFETEAVAGTAPRGKTPEEDIDLREQLLRSDKDRREQQLVAEYIREILRSQVKLKGLDLSPTIYPLPRLQHLRTRIKGSVRKRHSDISLLTKLHPTPAVAGYPYQPAIELIRELELFDRGWYAGPIGHIGVGSAEFAVGIRSLLVHDNLLILTAGAGIVKGSSAEAEWNEIENKLRSTLDLMLPK